jgi:hypothetical protein
MIRFGRSTIFAAALAASTAAFAVSGDNFNQDHLAVPNVYFGGAQHDIDLQVNHISNIGDQAVAGGGGVLPSDGSVGFGHEIYVALADHASKALARSVDITVGIGHVYALASGEGDGGGSPLRETVFPALKGRHLLASAPEVARPVGGSSTEI